MTGSAGPPLTLPLTPAIFNQLSLVNNPRTYKTPRVLSSRDSYMEEQQQQQQQQQQLQLQDAQSHHHASATSLPMDVGSVLTRAIHTTQLNHGGALEMHHLINPHFFHNPVYPFTVSEWQTSITVSLHQQDRRW